MGKIKAHCNGYIPITKEDADSMQLIEANLAASGLLKAGLALSFAKATDQASLGYSAVIVEQNWMMLRSMQRIENLLSQGKPQC